MGCTQHISGDMTVPIGFLQKKVIYAGCATVGTGFESKDSLAHRVLLLAQGSAWSRELQLTALIRLYRPLPLG